ncbi:replication initiation factor domain-containing protein [Geomonas sp. Red32]|uniref:replication initiation factor domain-containing protein n=1 Tax=Geomonas sp. Red32 TaxID=2912856 RepID=UPI00202CD2A2|nr:replication initiation factor domain-containing protein [Geomonas sp. Red32]MCM0082298.1 replication initiation factor domain-containing protein [Geomonas sp. Red32]
MFPNGKGDNYAFHLQFPQYHLYISKSEKFTSSPNVYLSINSKTMWGKGVAYVLDLATNDLKYFGGKIVEVLPSRLDICADFKLSSGLSLPFLEEHTVCRSRDVRPIIKGGILETCYFGSPAAPIRLRIYNKGKEVIKKGEKLWFADMWGTDNLEDIWRVEFQLRRAALKQFKINDFLDLWQRAGGV